ncbi:MAG TPA: nucleotide exchange factor GrpE [Pyrinomonadaceae bacterium]
MMNKNRQTPNRIPIRFLDEEDKASSRAASGRDEDAGGLTPEELGRASIYEGETEMQSRIDRGEERDDEQGRSEADDRDTAGSPDPSELEESRNDLDTTPPSTDSTSTNRSSNDSAEPNEAGESSRQAGGDASTAAAGPVMAELVATRAELRRVQSELQKAVLERQDLQERLTRRQADFENYRKRIERERAETYSRALAEVVGQLLPVVDNLQRALDAEATVQAGESEEFRHFLHGIELIGKQLNGLLEGLGVQPVETVGQPFDPHVHEAIAIEASDEYASDVVVEEIVRGYRLGDKLLRPAMVKVAK